MWNHHVAPRIEDALHNSKKLEGEHRYETVANLLTAITQRVLRATCPLDPEGNALPLMTAVITQRVLRATCPLDPEGNALPLTAVLGCLWIHQQVSSVMLQVPPYPVWLASCDHFAFSNVTAFSLPPHPAAVTAYVRQCTELGCISSGVVLVNDRPRLIVDEINIAHTHHISMLSEYTVDPSKTSGGG